MKMVPSLQATVRDTAGEVVTRLTNKFGLQALDVDEATLLGDLQPAAHRVDDAQVGLVRDEPVHVGLAEAGLLENLAADLSFGEPGSIPSWIATSRRGALS